MMRKDLIRCSHLRETGRRAPGEVCAAVVVYLVLVLVSESFAHALKHTESVVAVSS